MYNMELFAHHFTHFGSEIKVKFAVFKDEIPAKGFPHYYPRVSD
jgi:hypothetical protein